VTRRGTRDADDLVARHVELARRAAGRIYPRVRGLVSFDELRALANAGLAEAAGRYDPGRGATFATFAWYRIHGAIFDGLRRSSQRRATAPSPRLPPRMVSLEALCERGFDAAGDAPGPADDIDGARRAARLRVAIARLPDRPRALVTKHYFEGKSLLEAGAELGMSKSWASRLHAQAVDQLRALIDPIDPTERSPTERSAPRSRHARRPRRALPPAAPAKPSGSPPPGLATLDDEAGMRPG
jgi:RNA polymerase sigma factor for flagellar operon FliA